jgi:hypothetical protein
MEGGKVGASRGVGKTIPGSYEGSWAEVEVRVEEKGMVAGWGHGTIAPVVRLGAGPDGCGRSVYGDGLTPGTSRRWPRRLHRIV